MPSLRSFGLLALLLFSLVSCRAREAAPGPPELPLSEPTFAATALHLDRADSSIEFHASHRTNEAIRAKVTRFDGQMALTRETLTQLKLQLELTSVATGDRRLDEYMKSSQFFEVDRFPRLTFVSTSISPAPLTAPDAYTVNGVLSMHGIEKAFSFEARMRSEKGGGSCRPSHPWIATTGVW